MAQQPWLEIAPYNPDDIAMTAKGRRFLECVKSNAHRISEKVIDERRQVVTLRLVLDCEPKDALHYSSSLRDYANAAGLWWMLGNASNSAGQPWFLVQPPHDSHHFFHGPSRRPVLDGRSFEAICEQVEAPTQLASTIRAFFSMGERTLAEWAVAKPTEEQVPI